MGLWTSAEIVAATAGTSARDFVASGVSIDTRSLEKGDLFVALKDVRDGHDFVAQALEKGAAAALVSHVPEGVSEDAPLVIVPDVLEALEALARAARARFSGRVIGVTGSVGKTGTKEMLRTALSALGRVHAAEKSFNNHWGVPLTLARMPKDADFAVIEIGMNHPGEIAPLSKLARPHVGIITTVAKVHAEAFKNELEIAREKAALADGVEPGGVMVLNRDIRTYPILYKKAQKNNLRALRFGWHGRPEFALKLAKIKGVTTTVKFRHKGQMVLFKLGAPGKHLAMNAVAALAAVEAVDGDMAKAALALAHWSAPDGRGARWKIMLDDVENASIELIDESYNANPTSMEAALEVLVASEPINDIGRISGGRRIAILGDMLELGADEIEAHAALANLNVISKLNKVYTVGPRMKALHEALPITQKGQWFETSEKMLKHLRSLLDAGDVIMVKGSNGAKLSLVVEQIKKLGPSQMITK